MMVLKFRMLSDENDDFVRDYEILYDMTLAGLHEFIRSSLGYEECMASFFTADDRWERLREFTLVDMGDGSEDATQLMDDITLGQIIHNNRDRLIYLFDMIDQRAYYLELTEASQADNAEAYPRVVFARAEAPDQYDPSVVPGGGSIFDEAMDDFSDFDGDESYDDE